MKKKYLSLVFCFIIAFCLSGCIRVKEELKVNSDKTIDLKLTMATKKSEETVDSDDSVSMFDTSDMLKFSDEQIEEMEKAGYTVTDYDKDGYEGKVVEIKNVPFDKISETFSLANGESNSSDPLSITEKNGEYTIEMPYTSTADMSMYASSIKASGGEMLNTIEVPGKVISSNATDVNGKVLTWDWLKFKEDKITVTFTLSDGNPFLKWILIGLGILLLVIVLIVIISKLTGKKKENADPFGGYDYSGVAGGAMDAVGEGVEGAKDFIGDKVDDVKDFAEDKIDDAKEFVEDKIEDAPDVVKQGYEQVKGTVEDGVEAAKDAVGDGIDQAKDVAEDGIADFRSRFDN